MPARSILPILCLHDLEEIILGMLGQLRPTIRQGKVLSPKIKKSVRVELSLMSSEVAGAREWLVALEAVIAQLESISDVRCKLVLSFHNYILENRLAVA